LYYLAIGNARIKEYQTALKYVRGLLQVEPGNRQESILRISISAENFSDKVVANNVGIEFHSKTKIAAEVIFKSLISRYKKAIKSHS
jgi:hypothetical protein